MPVIERTEGYEKWFARRTGYVQGRLIGAGHLLGLESEMPPPARAVVAEALREFEDHWPRPNPVLYG